VKFEASVCRECKLEATACREYQFSFGGFALKGNGTKLDIGPLARSAVSQRHLAAMVTAEGHIEVECGGQRGQLTIGSDIDIESLLAQTQPNIERRQYK